MLDFKTYVEEGWAAVKKSWLSKSPEIIKQIESIDPTPNTKYGEWLFQNMPDNTYNDAKIRNMLKLFIKYKDDHHTDIYSLDSFQKFEDLIEQYREKEVIKSETKGGAEKLVDTEDYIILLIKNYEASCKYGANTKWCITSSDNQGDQSYWKDYNKHNIFLFVIFKNSKIYNKIVKGVYRDAHLKQIEFDSPKKAQKISVQIKNSNPFAEPSDLNLCEYWDPLDNSENEAADQMAITAIKPHFETIKKAVDEFRNSPERESSSILKAILLLKSNTASPQEIQEYLSLIEKSINVDTRSLAKNGVRLNVTQDSLNFIYKGSYLDNFEIFESAFTSGHIQDLVRDMINGAYYPAIYDTFDANELKSQWDLENDISTDNWNTIKDIELDEYFKYEIVLYDNDEEPIDNSEVSDREALEELISPYYTWKHNKIYKVDDAIQSGVLRLHESQVYYKIYKAITDAIDEAFLIEQTGTNLITKIPWSKAYQIIQYLFEFDEDYVDEGTYEIFDGDSILESLCEDNMFEEFSNNVWEFEGIGSNEHDQEVFNTGIEDSLGVV